MSNGERNVGDWRVSDDETYGDVGGWRSPINTACEYQLADGFWYRPARPSNFAKNSFELYQLLDGYYCLVRYVDGLERPWCAWFRTQIELGAAVKNIRSLVP